MLSKAPTGRRAAPRQDSKHLSLSGLWRSERYRAVFFQSLLIAGVIAVAWYLLSNTLTNLSNRNINTGFDFLSYQAGFSIGEAVIEFAASDPYIRAILVGLLNTCKVAVLAIVISTVLGTLIGIARLSGNWIVARLASIYVEGVRNVPLLLQLFVWYALLTEALPTNRDAWSPLSGVFISNRGLFFAVPVWSAGYMGVMLGVLLGGLAGIVTARRLKAHRERTGRGFPAFWSGCLVFALIAFLGWLLGGAPTALEVPVLKGLNYRGGAEVTPEFLALLLGLSVYTAGYIAEIVRSGIQSVPRGQREAAASLGMKPPGILAQIILPQALRVIVPPTTSWYLNTVKNSSLAVAIGYPDLVSVTNTAINQTGQAIEGIAIIMSVYLSLSLGISALMNWYNKRIALQGLSQSDPGGSLPVPETFDLLSPGGLLAWSRANLFSTWYNSLLTVFGAALVVFCAVPLIDWAVLSSVVVGGPEDCRAAEGACWAFVVEKHRFILFGTYPFEEQWRPFLAVLLFCCAIGLSCLRRFWSKWLVPFWAAVLAAIGVLMWGGVLGLSYVENSFWGGLPITLLLASIAIVCAFPLSILLALGRRSELPVVKAFCIAYIELIRGVPLISILFMAAIMLPLFLPPSLTIDNLLRAQVGLTLFAAAYMAEVLRGGLQSIPRGQYEAARSLGMGYWQTTLFIILPQVLRITIPAMVNTFISEVKNTTLVLIIGLFDLLHAAKAALTDLPWRPFYVEAYLFSGFIFFCICFFLSKYSQYLEREFRR
ncbi:ABC transporter permease subunit [Pelagibius sp. CAU 1746]|uniref:ABC transporter permease subunit n=1 Tax=Pelagibius sp. CAU 1746 TaxID=3140370 RepID=UPI00325BF223